MKAVLILDEMPSSCSECELEHRDDWIGLYCAYRYRRINTEEDDYADEKGRPDWCPLKEMPEKLTSAHDRLENCEIDFGWTEDFLYETGWNNCLKEITEEKS